MDQLVRKFFFMIFSKFFSIYLTFQVGIVSWGNRFFFNRVIIINEKNPKK